MRSAEPTMDIPRAAWLVLVAGRRQARCGAVADLVRSLGCDCVTAGSVADSIVVLLRHRREGRPVDVVVADEDLRREQALNEVLERTDTHVVSLDDVMPDDGEVVERPRGGAHVLVVEDEPVNRLVIAAILRNRGIGVTTVASGEEALDAVVGARFDAVLMDIELPGLSGPDTTSLIRSGDRTALFDPALPVIAITAHTGGMVDAWRRAGMTGYVMKPVEPADLLAALDGCLGD